MKELEVVCLDAYVDLRRVSDGFIMGRMVSVVPRSNTWKTRFYVPRYVWPR